VFGTLSLILVLIALASIYGNLIMRIRLMKCLPVENGFLWWKRSPGEVARTYGELFPKSYWPLIVRYAFWLFLLAAAVMLVFLWRSELTH
jgi:hypothetical protein